MRLSINWGTLKWMVYRNSHKNGCFRGTPISGSPMSFFCFAILELIFVWKQTRKWLPEPFFNDMAEKNDLEFRLSVFEAQGSKSM